MSVLHPLWLIAAAALAIGYFLLKIVTDRDDWIRVLKPEVFNFLQGNIRVGQRRLNGLLVAVICAVSLASPSTPTSDAESFRQSRGWIVLADLSRSMTLSDISPSRLSAMRDAAATLASRSSANPLALIVFSGDAFLITPPAFDTTHYATNIALLEHGLIPVEGTNLTRALALTASIIENNQMIDSRILVLSDTGGITANAQTAVARLSAAGHTTDMIVFGTENTATNAEFDLDAARKLAHMGNGELVVADALGRVSFDALQLSDENYGKNDLVHSGIELLRWSNQSHWLLLLALPFVLSLFARERR